MTTIDMSASSGGTFKAMLWTGRVLSGLVIAFCIFDFGIKFSGMPIVDQTGAQLGWHAGTAPMLGIILAVCTALYAYPRTAVLGAILLTGYLGGAVATHVRVDSPLFSHILFGVYLGIMAWGGLWLRDPKLRALFPVRRD
jgi:hypothetical protein